MSYSPYAPPQAAPYAPMRVYEPLGWKTTATVVLMAASVALTLLLLLVVRVVGTPSAENALLYAGVLGIFGLVLQVLSIGASVLFLVWMHQASKNVHAFHPVGLTFTPGWCVLWWFIPVLGMWKPYQVLKEIFLASDPSSLVADEPWRIRAVPGTFPLWWATYLGSGALSIGGLIASGVAAARRTDQSPPGQLAIVLSMFASVMAVVALASIMRQLDRRQVATQAWRLQGAQLLPGA